MDILTILCFVYIFIGLFTVGIIGENKVSKDNYLYFFKRPRNNFTKLCMVIFSPILLTCIISYTLLSLIAFSLFSIIVIFVIPFIFIYNTIINSDIYKYIKREIRNVKLYKFLFEER